MNETTQQDFVRMLKERATLPGTPKSMLALLNGTCEPTVKLREGYMMLMGSIVQELSYGIPMAPEARMFGVDISTLIDGCASNQCPTCSVLLIYLQALMMVHASVKQTRMAAVDEEKLQFYAEQSGVKA